MKKKSIIIITSVIAVVVCVAIVVGTTFALFSSSSSIDISFTAGQVKLDAKVKDLTLYSAVADANGSEKDENNQAYSYKKMGGGKFINGGTVEFSDDCSLSLNNICPGDKLEFKVDLTNNSTIQIKYRIVWTLLMQQVSNLFDALQMEVAVVGQNGDVQLDVAAEAGSVDKMSSDVELDVGNNSQCKITIWLPVSAPNSLQGISIKTRCYAFAIQNSSAVHGLGIIQRDDEILGEETETLQSLVDMAVAGDVIYLVRGSERAESVTIDKDLTIESYNDEPLVLTDFAIAIENDVNVTLSHVGFGGTSTVDVSRAKTFTMTNCVVDVNPDEIYYNGNRLDKSFIIAKPDNLLPVELNITDNLFIGENAYAAVQAYSPVANGSVISGNIFGSPEQSYQGNAVVLKAEASAVVKVTGNAFYASHAIDLNGADGGFEYSVVLSDNMLIANGTPVLVTVNGAAAVNVYDTGSKVYARGSVATENGVVDSDGHAVAGTAVTFGNFAMDESLRFVGVNVTFYEHTMGSAMDVISGSFKLYGGYTAELFRNSHTVPGLSNVTIEE